MRSAIRVASAAALILAAGAAPRALAQQAPTAEQSYAEIEQAFGFVPEFLRAMPPAAIPGAWAEMRDLQFSKDTALSPKVKELIGLAVAAQIPCEYCIYAHTSAARAAGATDAEIAEAVAMAAVTRHWSTILNGLQLDPATFRAEFDKAMAKGE